MNRGFTIVELLVVVVVIAVLAAITIISYNGIQQRATRTKIDTSVAQVKRALEMYRAENGIYPNACGTNGVECPYSSLTNYLAPQFISVAPTFDVTVQYVATTGPAGYALRVFYPGITACKTGVNMNPAWWGAPECT